MGVFEDIYKNDSWGFGSGHGSLPRVTKGYRSFLEMFIRENNIKSVVDYGCGDWQFSQLIDWGKVKYTGVDIVPAVINRNNEKFSTERIKFLTIDPGTTKLPEGELLIVKDVLQHWPNAEIKKFLEHIIPYFQYSLITNCSIPTNDLNMEIKMGGFRPLDIRLSPFLSPATAIYEFYGPRSFSKSERRFFPAWKKLVLLTKNK